MFKRLCPFILIMALLFAPAITNSASKPTKVKQFKVTKVTASSVSLKWKKSKRAKKYQVYISTGKKFRKAKTLKKTRITIKKLKSNTRYKFKVRGINGKKKGRFSTVKTVRTKPTNKVIIQSKPVIKPAPINNPVVTPSTPSAPKVPSAKIPDGWTPDQGFEMFTPDFDGDLSAAFGFGNDACVLASLKYSKGIDKTSSDLDILRCVAEWMTDNISYAVNPTSNGIPRATACAGYSHYYKHILSYFDIDSVVVVAYPEDVVSHAWNLVKYNNKWYAVDVTWFDCSGLPGKLKYSFQWFMKSSKYFSESHVGGYNSHCYGTKEELDAYCEANNLDPSCFMVATATDMDDYDWSEYGDNFRHLVQSWDN